MPNRLDRRTFLKGTGVSLALPMLDAMRPAVASTGKSETPKRFAAFYVPNGVNWDYYTPEGDGSDWGLPQSLKGLKPLKQHVSFLSGLSHPSLGTPHFGCDNWLTGADFHISNYQNSISIDQRLAEAFGDQTRYPSLELTGDHADSLRYGFMTTLAWSRAGKPILGENNPRRVFERLFVDEGASDFERKLLRLKRHRSILDELIEQSRALSNRLGPADRAKLEEYFTSVREVERRIQRAEQWAHVPKAKLDAEGLDLNVNPDTRLDSYVRTMMDLLVLSFQTDTTRIGTYVIAREGGGTGSANYKAIGVTDDHHKLSHQNKNPESREKLRLIDTFHVDQLSYFLSRLSEIDEGDGSLLDNSAVLFGSGLSVGWSHNHKDLPILLAGGLSPLKQGHHYNLLGKRIPLSNLFVSLLNKYDVEVERFGTSTGNL
ncbi:DUF1552 domain-containing protein [Stratiformator vulcanicus]|uniref:DUF1552 domain-containing protein n=1 Tax=Stratiformator vulcanicus TaxID=2527980 RepID=A0A517R171_9PLAN|nr:DUF1552 domain-containing protein [Stratiformator vulcanicus]QDT37606.1 hypothetical protein Pan189_19860 [Stratiformator vulcanicus]